MEPVVVYQTANALLAHLICSRLRAAGMLAAVNHEFSAQHEPWGAARIRVEVPASQATEAHGLLAADA